MELTQCINYLLTTAQHKVFQEMSSRLEKFDVTPVSMVSCIVMDRRKNQNQKRSQQN